MTRRQLLLSGAALPLAAQTETLQKKQRKGRLKQGVCGGVFGRGLSFEEQCKQAARLGAQVVDLVEPDRWATVEKYGLKPNMIPGGGRLADGLNEEANHPSIEKAFQEKLPAVREAQGHDHDRSVGQPPWQDRRAGLGRMRQGPQEGHSHRGKRGRDHLHGVAELQGGPQGLPVRPHCLGSRTRETRQLAPVQTAV